MHAQQGQSNAFVTVSVGQQKSSSSRVAKAFTDVILNAKQPTEPHWNVTVPDTSQGGSFHHYFKYLLLSDFGSTPFEITPGSYGQQLAKMQVYVVHEYNLVSTGIQLEIVLQQTSR